MTTSPAQVIQTLLANPRDLANVKSVTTPDVTYVSLNEDNPELKRYLPWTGTNQGPESHRPHLRRNWAGVGDEGLRGPRGHRTGRQGRDVRLVYVSGAPVRPGNHFALRAPGEGERRQNSLHPVSRGHVRYLGNARTSAILTTH